jgi:dienelactone hydrolase
MGPTSWNLIVQTQVIEYALDGATYQSYAAFPDNSKKYPCVLVAPAWHGLLEPEKQKCTELAKLGYVGFALDLYGKDKRGDLSGDNSHLISPLLQNRDELQQRLKAGVDAAKNLPNVDTSRMIIIGYCFGGLCALDLARNCNPDIKAAVSFHGIFETHDFKTSKDIQAKVLILHGYDDPMATPAQMVAVGNELTARKADWQIHAYGNTMHAFTNPGAKMPQHGILYNEAAARRSWQSALNFFKEVFA